MLGLVASTGTSLLETMSIATQVHVLALVEEIKTGEPGYAG